MVQKRVGVPLLRERVWWRVSHDVARQPPRETVARLGCGHGIMTLERPVVEGEWRGGGVRSVDCLKPSIKICSETKKKKKKTLIGGDDFLYIIIMAWALNPLMLMAIPPSIALGLVLWIPPRSASMRMFLPTGEASHAVCLEELCWGWIEKMMEEVSCWSDGNVDHQAFDGVTS